MACALIWIGGGKPSFAQLRRRMHPVWRGLLVEDAASGVRRES